LTSHAVILTGKRALPGVLFAALVIAVYADPLLARRNFVGRDLRVYNLPMEMTVHEAYSRGKLPVWSAEISGGRPLAPNPNAGAMYPVRPLLSAVQFPLAMRLFPILHWIAAGIGMILLLRSLGASAAGAWIGAVTYVFSGVGVAEVFFPNLHPGMALLPWVVWTVARRTASVSGKVVPLSVLYGLLFLAGDVFTIGMAILASCLWILFERERRDRWRELGLLAASLALAALIAAPQILSTLLWVPDTNRAVVGMQLRESLFFSIHPLRLLELVVPFPFGSSWSLDDTGIWGWPVYRYKAMGMFTSLYAGAFAFIALVATRKTRSPGFRFGRALFLVALVISVPPSLVPRDWEKLPSPLPLRNPEKFSVILVFALAVVAGLAFEGLRSRAARHRWVLAVAAALTALAAAAALFPAPVGAAAASVIGDERYATTASEKLPGALAEGGLLWMAALVALDRLYRPRRANLAAALALLTLVPIEANRKIARTQREQDIFTPPLFARYLEREDPKRLYRTVGVALYQSPRSRVVSGSVGEHLDQGRRVWIHYTPVLWRRGMVFNVDLDVGDFTRMESLRKLSVIAAGFTDSDRLFGSLALRWAIRFRDESPLPGYRPVGGNLLQEWDELETALPSIRLVEAWREEASPLDALNTLPRLTGSEIVLETGRRASGHARPGAIRVLEDSPETLRVQMNSPDPTWLFVLRGYWPYRSVEIDGLPVECVPAQIAYSAVAVPAGRHTVEWKERLPGFEVSRWGPFLFIPFAVGLIVRDRARRTRRLS
jgi:hypothetical protein